ncbi:MAG: hypothetical protein ABEJ74_05770 [Haloferacaceae archaeon]
MVSAVDLVLLAATLALQTFLAAVTTRFLRIRMNTRWGTAIYVALLVPVLLTVTTIVITGVLNVGWSVDIGSRLLVLALFVGLPAALGVTIDVLYVVPPEEYELPAERS